MKNQVSKKQPNKWMGPQGFDEAKYYNDEKYEIGIEHSDETIKEKVIETFSRNPILSMTDIEVAVKDGLVTISGQVQGKDEKKEASDSIQNLTGVKAVRNLLHY